MKKTIFIICAVVLMLSLTTSVAQAFPDDMTVGQKTDEAHPDGTVTRVEFSTDEHGNQLIMPYRGDFGGDPYLDDGWVMNIYTHEDFHGYITIYRFVHETDPRYTGENPIWGSWDFDLEIHGGQFDRANSGKQ